MTIREHGTLQERNEEVVRALFAATFHEAAPGLTADADGVAQMMHAAHSGVSDCEIEIDSPVSDHAEVVVRYIARGRLTGELFGMPPTSGPIGITGIEWYRLRGDGLLTDYWAHSSTTFPN
jgi:SnoaL-like polyketide cyclase